VAAIEVHEAALKLFTDLGDPAGSLAARINLATGTRRSRTGWSSAWLTVSSVTWTRPARAWRQATELVAIARVDSRVL
jgi:hypothetical protein